MQDYLIILGREPELGVAEITSVTKRLALPWQWQLIDDPVALGRGELRERFLSSLAGTIKIGQVLGEIKADKLETVQFIKKNLPSEVRCEFGFSWYGSKQPRWLISSGLSLKNNLKDKGRHVRFITSRTPTLSSVVVKKNRLLPPEGYEFLFYSQGEKIIIARTIWVQDFEGWSERDYGRPLRDARVGMLPPKLARIMINLAEAREGAGILDPFCGSGTVLQEAAMLGYRHLVGTDIDEQGLKRTRANFSWLKQSYTEITPPALMATDIKNLLNILKNSSIDAVVTEPYLGPPLHGKETKQRLEEIRKELTDFYFNTLKVLSKIIKSSGRVVMVYPVWRDGNNFLTLPLVFNQLKNLGLTLVDTLPKEAPADWRNSRGTLWYARPDAKVMREIVVFRKE